MMSMKYKINGVVLDIHDLIEVSEYYEAACTADWVLETYSDLVSSEEEALSIGYEVRRKMNDWGRCSGQDEEDAIVEVLKERGILKDD